MTTDAWLAIIHHLAVLRHRRGAGREWALVRPGMEAAEVRRLVRIDSAYGALAAVVLSAGVARVFLGAKPASFYTSSTTFWLKIATFAAVGLLSIRPTIRYLGWRRGPRRQTPAPPRRSEVSRTAGHRPPDRRVRLHPRPRSPHGSRHRRLTPSADTTRSSTMNHSLDGWDIGHAETRNGRRGAVDRRRPGEGPRRRRRLLPDPRRSPGRIRGRRPRARLPRVPRTSSTARCAPRASMHAGDGYAAAHGSVHTDFATETGATYLSSSGSSERALTCN